MSLAIWLSRRFVAPISRGAALTLAALPLVFTGKAILLGRLYGPADIIDVSEPWRRLAAEHGIHEPRSPILSDLAFANLPWRAAVREAVVNGRLPFWNRFVLAGNPLLAAAQAGVFHPSTWIGLWLPLPLSWTFSCAFTLFLGGLAAFLFFRDFSLGDRAALVGAIGWGFSTYLVFWNGWSVGPSTATLPLLLLGLRRLSREPSIRAVGLTAAAIWLAICGGHPESVLHSGAAGAVYFVWELAGARGRFAARAIGAAVAAGVLASLLAGPQLFPLLAAIPHSAEYRSRREAVERGGSRQSVAPAEAWRRLLPDALPFAHGIYGRSAVQADRGDGSGMALGYSGAVLFPLALLSLAPGRRRERGRSLFAGLLVAGLLFGASAPGLLDVAARLPGFALALNYRLVFLAGLGLAGLAASGAQELESGDRARALARLAGVCSAALIVLCLLSRPVLRARELSPGFVGSELAFEVVPVIGLALAALVLHGRPARLGTAAIALLVAQRGLELGGIYPTLPPETLAPRLPTLESLPLGSEPSRFVARDGVLRPNAAALYRLEDVRGYESIVLDRFADTYPLWSRPQPASFNRVDDPGRPFLSLLNARYALGVPEDPTPPGWKEQARGPEMAVFESPSALPRAFVPRALRREPDPGRRLAEMGEAKDFAESAWLSAPGPPRERNGRAAIRLRAAGPDLIVSARAFDRVFVATSLTDWPGWRAEDSGALLPLETVNHAFVGFWLAPGDHAVRLSYRPEGWGAGLAAFAGGVVAVAGLLLAARRGSPTT